MIRLKAMKRKSRKRASWAKYVHQCLHSEFERLIELGVKVTSTILLDIAVDRLHFQTAGHAWRHKSINKQTLPKVD